jgi:ribonuclease P protein component
MEVTPNDRHFRKAERLCGTIRTERLFTEGKGFIVYPLRIVYRWIDEDAQHAKLLISVPKKKIRCAVDRNRLKRLIREAYRNNKHLIDAAFYKEGKSLHLGIVYLASELVDYGLMEEKIITSISRLNKGLVSGK